MINQLILHNGGEKGKRIGSLLLTSLGATLGNVPTFYNTDYSVSAPVSESPVCAGKVVPRTLIPRKFSTKICNGKVVFPRQWHGKAVVVYVFDVRGRLVKQLTMDQVPPALDIVRDVRAARGMVYLVKARIVE